MWARGDMKIQIPQKLGLTQSGYNTYKGVFVKLRILNELRKNEERVTFFVRDPLCGSFKGVELTGTLPSFFVEIKIKTLIYQCFYFAVSAKNAIFCSLPLRSAYNSDKWRFNASFVPLACVLPQNKIEPKGVAASKLIEP